MPRKKIFDIIPPGGNNKTDRQDSFSPQKFSKASGTKPSRKARLFFSQKIIFSIAIFTILAFAGSAYFLVEPVAEIKVWPKTEELTLKTQLLAAAAKAEIGSSKDFIPAEIIEAEGSVSQNFPASGKSLKEEKTRGKVRIYNNYTTSQVLISGTRLWCFVEEGMREFKTQERITVPSKQYIDVDVLASASGEEYNIEPCTFSIPGLKGTSRYTAVYGKSFEPMTGGLKAEVPKVTQDDKDRAKEILTSQALEKSKTLLRNKLSENQILLDGAQDQEVLEAFINEEANTADNFSFTVKGRTQGLVFNKSDIDNFAEKYILSNLPEDKNIQENSLAVKYSSADIDLSAGKIVLDLDVSANTYTKIDQDLLRESAKNRTPEELRGIFQNFPEILKIEVEISPFWAREIPQSAKMIKIKLVVE